MAFLRRNRSLFLDPHGCPGVIKFLLRSARIRKAIGINLYYFKFYLVAVLQTRTNQHNRSSEKKTTLLEICVEKLQFACIMFVEQ